METQRLAVSAVQLLSRLEVEHWALLLERPATSGKTVFLPAAVEAVAGLLLLVVAVVDSGVKRNRWTVPLGIAACMSCCPGPGRTVIP